MEHAGEKVLTTAAYELHEAGSHIHLPHLHLGAPHLQATHAPHVHSPHVRMLTLSHKQHQKILRYHTESKGANTEQHAFNHSKENIGKPTPLETSQEDTQSRPSSTKSVTFDTTTSTPISIGESHKDISGAPVNSKSDSGKGWLAPARVGRDVSDSIHTNESPRKGAGIILTPLKVSTSLQTLSDLSSTAAVATNQPTALPSFSPIKHQSKTPPRGKTREHLSKSDVVKTRIAVAAHASPALPVLQQRGSNKAQPRSSRSSRSSRRNFPPLAMAPRCRIAASTSEMPNQILQPRNTAGFRHRGGQLQTKEKSSQRRHHHQQLQHQRQQRQQRQQRHQRRQRLQQQRLRQQQPSRWQRQKNPLEVTLAQITHVAFDLQLQHSRGLLTPRRQKAASDKVYLYLLMYNRSRMCCSV